MLVAKIKTKHRTEKRKFIFGAGKKSFSFLGKNYFINPDDIYRCKFIDIFGYSCIDYVQDIPNSVNYFNIDREDDKRSYEGINDTIKAWKLSTSRQLIMYILIGVGIAAAIGVVNVIFTYSVYDMIQAGL